MSVLIELQERLQEVGASIGRLESGIANSPDLAAMANFRSFQRYQRKLELEFQSEAEDRGFEICSYRLFANNFHPTVGAVARALGGFQSALSVAFDALKNGPKPTMSLSGETVRATQLGIAYTFPGSFGVVMTVRNEQLLGDIPTVLDDAIHSVFEIAKAQAPSDVSLMAKSLGAGPIRAMYQWAHGHAKYKAGADIDWRRGDSVRDCLVRQYEEIEVLRDVIAETSEESSSVIDISGVLVGANIKSHTFHFASSSTASDIRGRFSDAISESEEAKLPGKYLAKIRVTRKMKFSTEKEELSYFLLNLKEIAKL